MGQQEFITPEGLRRDGRRANELRRIRCQVSVLQNADGSAMFQMGNTQVWGTLPRGVHSSSAVCVSMFNLTAWVLPQQVLASVFGPREVDNRSQNKQEKAVVKCEYAMAAFSTGEARDASTAAWACTHGALPLHQWVGWKSWSRSMAGVFNSSHKGPPCAYSSSVGGTSHTCRPLIYHCLLAGCMLCLGRQASAASAARQTGAPLSYQRSSATRWSKPSAWSYCPALR